MKNILIWIILAFLCVGAAFGQDGLAPKDYAYGKPFELKGLTTLFINTGTDMKSRERLTKEIQKALPNLHILDEADSAQMIIIFEGDSEQSFAEGGGVVLIPGKTGDRPRLVFSYSNRQQHRMEQKPLTKFIKEFVKVYKNANGVK